MIVLAEIDHLWERGSDFRYTVIIDTSKLDETKEEDKLILDNVNAAISWPETDVTLNSVAEEALMWDIEQDNRYTSFEIEGKTIDKHVTLWYGED